LVWKLPTRFGSGLFISAGQPPPPNDSDIRRKRDTALAPLAKYIARRAFIEVTLDLDTAIGAEWRVTFPKSTQNGSAAEDLTCCM
jgi:hypothetical protein